MVFRGLLEEMGDLCCSDGPGVCPGVLLKKYIWPAVNEMFRLRGLQLHRLFTGSVGVLPIRNSSGPISSAPTLILNSGYFTLMLLNGRHRIVIL